MQTIAKYVLAFISLIIFNTSYAAIMIPMYFVDAKGEGKSIGSIKAEDSVCGVLLTPMLHDLKPGIHGFHIHEKPDCSEKGMAAGGHLDPNNSKEHNGPYQTNSHLGDLPVLIVDKNGYATLPTLAPRFKLADISHRALMIHAGGDNYSDQPEKLGGGGERIACGIIGG